MCWKKREEEDAQTGDSNERGRERENRIRKTKNNNIKTRENREVVSKRSIENKNSALQDSDGTRIHVGNNNISNEYTQYTVHTHTFAHGNVQML